MKDRYNSLLQELRFRYQRKYNVTLDDEILYIIIRLNELQVDLKKDIKRHPPLSFPSSLDYFYFGLGKSINYLVAGIGLTFFGFLVSFSIHTSDHLKVISVDGKTFVRVHAESNSGKDTTILLPLH